MKIYIEFRFKDQPFGGCNQFLKSLRNYFLKLGVYTDNYQEADVVLFNSFLFIPETLKLKKTKSNIIFVHRVDGPMRLYNKMSDKRDLLNNYINEILADATIFQSKWSKEKNLNMEFPISKYNTTIMNAPDPTIFNKNGKTEFSNKRKTRLIATSWSCNPKKGFETYKWLDDNLNFNKFEMTFAGNSPVEFNNIKKLDPLNSVDLAKELKKHDVFITASQNDPCSNSLIEAMHCGLPALALNNGGHPEIVANGGLLFNKASEIPGLLDKIVENYSDYKNKISLSSMDSTGAKYLHFITDIYNKVQKEEYAPKQLTKKQIRKSNIILKYSGLKITWYSRLKVIIKRILKKFD